MKKLALAIGCFIFLDLTYFSYANFGHSLNVNYKPILNSLTLDTGLTIAIVAIYAALGAFLISFYQLSGLKDQLKKQSRKSEKAAVETEESSDRVKLLEAKIQTLEVALKEALKSK